jgi:hypothetical protein
LKDKTYQARVAALSIAQYTTMVNLLRAHGQNAHAENAEAAINEVVGIISNELGGDTLAQAMRWVSDATEDGAEPSDSVATRH